MKLPRATNREQAFTLMEIMVASLLTVLVVGTGLVLSEGTGRMFASITSQSSHNQKAGNGVEMMLQRIRVANFATNDSAGDSLLLSFDDNPDSDSNGDGITWNDQDHFEQFMVGNSDTNWATLKDNYIAYVPNTNSSTTQIIIPASVRKILGQPIFSISNRVVFINFGVLTTNETPFSQMIEIRTKASLRNKLK